jgi:hypothetical protein
MSTKTKTETPGASSPYLASPSLIPTHEEISVEAEILWRQRGCPTGIDEQLWLEAERQLHSVMRAAQGRADLAAPAEPLSRMDLNSDAVMEELEELFPMPAGKETTSV